MNLPDKDLIKLSQILSELIKEKDKGNNFDSVVVPIDTLKQSFQSLKVLNLMNLF